MTRKAIRCVLRSPARIPHSGSVVETRRNPHSPRANSCPRRAVTLVELLIAITILAILAGLILGVGAVAAETAREAQTESTIARIHTLLMDHYDTFRNRRVSLNDNYGTALDNAPSYDITGLNSGQLLALGRTAGTRELLKIELPDRWSDV
ncbi:MAG: prepilin-type N-terminal cleavage/methylation domain-containing protein, partial [Planctomycetota bacterium]